MSNSKFNLFKKIKVILTPDQRKEFFGFISLFLLVMIFEAVGLGLIFSILSMLSENNLNSSFPRLMKFLNIDVKSIENLFFLSVLILLFVYTIKTLFLTYVAYKEEKFRAGIKTALPQKLFEIYLRKPFAYHLQTNSAQLMRNLNDVSECVAFVKYTLLLLVEIIVLTGVLILLIYYQPLGAITSVLSLGIIGFIFHKKVQKKAGEWGKIRQEHYGLRLMHIQQGFGAVKDIKVLGRENEFVKHFSESNIKTTDAEFKQGFVLDLPRLWLEWLAVFGMVLLIFLMISSGSDLTLLVPTLGLFAAAAFRLLPSVTRIMNSLQRIRFALPVVDTISAEIIFSDNEKNKKLKIKNSEIIIKNNIELNKINYIYPNNNKKTLSNLNLKIKCGTSIGLVGPSGIGKTTLINVILGLLQPNEGELLVNGKNIFEGMRSWQDQIGYVPQDIYLNDDTIKKNIAFGVPENEISNEKINNTINGAQLSKFINTLENGIDTKVGECGDRISGGQRQRIGIARALYNNPKILVLDEATNSLDSKTEEGIIDEVNCLKGEKTIVMIAHRTSTLSKCEKIYKLTETGLEPLEQ